MILEKMRTCSWKLKPGFWTYDWICGPKLVSRPQAPRSRHFFEILWFYWIFPMILEKMRSCLWKLESGFRTYGWIHLQGPSGPNLVSRPQAPRARHFWVFNILMDSSHDSWENEVLLVKIRDRVPDLRLDMSSGPKCPKFSF